MAAYRARVKAEIEKSQLVNREIRQRVNVSPQEIERYYQTHLPNYATSARVRVRDIFFSVPAGADDVEVAHIRAKAEEVRQLARDGRDFAALARQFSEGPGADKGGDLGSFARGEMESALEDAAFRLKPGEVSEPIQTAAGFHLLRAEEDIAAGHNPLDEHRGRRHRRLPDAAPLLLLVPLGPRRRHPGDRQPQRRRLQRLQGLPRQGGALRRPDPGPAPADPGRAIPRRRRCDRSPVG